MTRFLVMLRREIAGTFNSFGAWALLAIDVAITAYVYQFSLEQHGFETSLALKDVHGWLFILTMFLSPLLTMRLFAEEKKSGSLELLMTAPVRDVEVVASKFVAVVIEFVVFLLPIWVIYGILTTIYDAQPDYGQLAATSLGLFSLATVFASIGILASALTSSQVWAALLAMLGSLALWMLRLGKALIEPGTRTYRVLDAIDLQYHLETCFGGVIDLRFLVVQVTLAAAVLFVTVRVLEARQWL